jgi:predicted RNA-binding protein
MCEADVYRIDDGQEKLILAPVDILEPQDDGQWRLVGIFGDQKILRERIKTMNITDHKIIFEAC